MKYIVTNPVVVDCLFDERKVPCSLENGFLLKFIREKEGVSFFEVIKAYDNLMGGIACLNEEQVKASLSEVKEEEKKDEPIKEVKYQLCSDKQYAGDDGINYIILFLQNNNISDHIERDDSHHLFADLGPIEMFPDAEDIKWIMKLNSRIPMSTCMSIACKVKEGKKHLGVVLHDRFV